MIVFEFLGGRMSRVEENGKGNSVPELVDTRGAAKILGRSPATLKRWRLEGIGPDFIQIHNRVRYDVSVLLEFIKLNTRVPSVRANMEEIA
jgi:hypothetical protein